MERILQTIHHKQSELTQTQQDMMQSFRFELQLAQGDVLQQAKQAIVPATICETTGLRRI